MSGFHETDSLPSKAAIQTPGREHNANRFLDAFIIAGGSFTESDARQLLAALNKRSLIITADRGTLAALQYGIPVHLAIGDFDSVSDAELAALQKHPHFSQTEWIRLNPIKDDTDTEAALQTALERTSGTVYIYGGTGTRLDHVLANIHILQIAAKQGRKAYLIDGHNRIRILTGSAVLSRKHAFGRYVSLFPMTGAVTHLTLTGFRYPLTDATLKSGSSLGTSNELIAEEGQIRFSDGVLILIESRD